jgi:hypothetical protein
MATTMNMSGYEIEREEVNVAEYGDDVMYAEWNPQLAQLSDLPATEKDKNATFLPELANVDVDNFLKRMYEYQR